jgi:CRP-like cAMP-binding protein
MSQENEETLARAEKLRQAGLLEKAAEAYRQYLTEAPRDVEVHRKRADLLVKLGDRDGAISAYFKIQEILSAGGDILGAIAAGKKVSQLDPSCDNPLSYVAQVQTQSLEQERARQRTETVPYAPVRRLPDIPLLADLRPAELATVAGNMKVHEHPEGALVFAEGEAGDSLFFVTRGLLEAAAGSAKFGRLQTGDCFGEFSFLTGQPRTATVRVLEAAELLELSSADMKAVVAEHPRVREVLFKLYRERAMENVLARSPLFGIFGKRDRERVASRLELVTLGAGQTLFQRGAEGAAIYLIKTGQVEVRGQAPDGREVALATLGPHQFFGEVSFLTGVPRTATIIALEDCELLKLDGEELRRLVNDYPELSEILKRYHMDRVLATAETIKGLLRQSRVEGLLH